MDISIHALREEGDIQRRTGAVAHRISIHALREEGDPCQPDHRAGNLGFLSTPSARRATLYNLDPRPGRMDFYPRPPRGGRRAVLPGAELPRRISIHALREEGDLYFWPFVSR